MNNMQYNLYNDIDYFENMLSLLNSEYVTQDLHIHTDNSDGLLSLENTCKKIQHSAIDFFCITDHNFIVNIPMKCLFETNKTFIYGTELSCSYNGTRVHMLGYFLNIDNLYTRNIIAKIHKGHLEREKLRIENMHKNTNIKLSYEDFLQQNKNKVPNWRRIATSLVLSGDANSIEDASNRFLSKGKSGYISYSDNWSKVDARDAALAITKDGGIPVIAHLGDLEHSLGLNDLIKLLSDVSLCGVMGYDVSNSGKHRRISEELVNICNTQFGLIPFYGTDSHNAEFMENYSKSSIGWLNILLCRYIQKYLGRYLNYELIDLIHASVTSNFDFRTIPQGYINVLKKKSIITFRDLLEEIKCKEFCYNNTILCVIIIINCLSFCSAEMKLKKLVYTSLNTKEPSIFIKNKLKKMIIYFKHNIKTSLDITGKKELIRIWIPIFYRVNMYDIANELLNEILINSCFFPFIEFCKQFNLYKLENFSEMQECKYLFDSIVSCVSQMRFVNNILIRKSKSLASCYQKFVKCYLLDDNPKIPLSKDMKSNDESYYHRIYEDIYAATIITNFKIDKKYLLSILKKKRIEYDLKYCSDISRRWYHQRIIFLFNYKKIIFEILIKTSNEYWFAYYYYWKTKNYLIFDIESRALSNKVNSDTVSNDKMVDFAIKELIEYIKRKSDFNE